MSWLIGIGICLFGVMWLEIKRLDDNDDNDSPPDE